MANGNTMRKYAFATLLTSDSYLQGALTLVAALRDVHPSPAVSPEVEFETVCIVTPETVDVSTVKVLRKAFDVVVGVEVITQPDDRNLQLLGRPDLNTVLTKIHAFRLTQYSKVVFLDADVLPIRPLSHLFTLPHEFSAAPDVGWPDIFNSGVLVFSPGEEKFAELNDLLKSKGSWDGGDQGLLNEWRGSDWNRLSFTYNTTPTAAYTYAPAYERFGSQISAIHFIGPNKPWSFAGYRAPFLHGEKSNSDATTDATIAYDYESLIDKWYNVYDKHYRATSVLPTSQFAPTHYPSAWNQQGIGAQLRSEANALSLDELKKLAIEGLGFASTGMAHNASHIAQNTSREGEYWSLPLEGRVDLIRPVERLPSPVEHTNPESPNYVRNLPTPGPNEVPPSPHLSPVSLPSSAATSVLWEEGARGQEGRRGNNRRKGEGRGGAEEWRRDSHHRTRSSQSSASQWQDSSRGSSWEAAESSSSEHGFHHPEFPVQHGAPPQSEPKRIDWATHRSIIDSQKARGVHHHNAHQSREHHRGGEEHRLSAQQIYDEPQALEAIPYRSPPRPPSPPMLSWNPALESPPNSPPPPSAFPSDTYFSNVWDQTPNRQHDQGYQPSRAEQASGAFFQPPPLPQIPESLRRQGHYDNILGSYQRSATPSPPGSNKVKSVFPWESKPRQAPSRRFPDGEVPSPEPPEQHADSLGSPPQVDVPTAPDSSDVKSAFPWENKSRKIPSRRFSPDREIPPPDHHDNVPGAHQQPDASTTPSPNKTKPVFPWESKPRQMPSRRFPEGEVPPPEMFVNPEAALPAAPVTTSPGVLSPSRKQVLSPVQTPSTLAFRNAWDAVPSIHKYGSRMKPQGPLTSLLDEPFDSEEWHRRGGKNWDQASQASNDGDDEDEDSDSSPAPSSKVPSRSRRGSSISASYMIKGKKKDYIVRGVQTISPVMVSQGVQVETSVPQGSSLQEAEPSRLRKPSNSRPGVGSRRHWAPPSVDALSASFSRTPPEVPTPTLESPTVRTPTGGFGSGRNGNRRQSVSQQPISPPSGLLSPREYLFDSPDSPRASPKTVTPTTPRPPGTRPLVRRDSSSTPSTSSGPISPPDSVRGLPIMHKAARVFDPARGVEAFKRGSEEVLARFLKMSSWEDPSSPKA